MSRDAILETVVRAALRVEPAAVIVPPCCDHPDVATAIETGIRTRLPRDVLLAVLKVDACSDEAEFCASVYQETLASRPELMPRWREIRSGCDDLAPPAQLKAFGSFLAAEQLQAVLVLGKFRQLFSNMSATLLAALRDLEAVNRIVCINVTSLSYGELYRLRTVKEDNFVSDYGQMHPQHEVGVWSQEEARAHWERKLPELATLDAETARADGRRIASEQDYFEVAYELTGGFPFAMQLAERIIGNFVDRSGPFPRLPLDLRPFRAELLAQASKTLRYVLDDGYERCTLAADVDRVERGADDAPEALARLAGHPWAGVILTDDRLGVRCPALARAALLELGEEARLQRAADLYAAGQFRQARLACLASERRTAALSEVMESLFPNGDRDLYFTRDIRWQQVRSKLAIVRDLVAAEPEAVVEIDRWLRITDAFLRGADGLDLPALATGEVSLRDVEDALILLGTRVIAVIRDRNPVTATHVSVPLLEDILRHYLVLVERRPTTGAVFDELVADELQRWWGDVERPFVPPPRGERLNGAALAVAAAALSDRSGRRMFEAQVDLRTVLNAMGNTRNDVGHRYRQPGIKEVRRIAEPAFKLLERLAAAGGASPTPADLQVWLAPPRHALDRGTGRARG